MKDRIGKPFHTFGQFSTVRSHKPVCKISCPACNHISYSHYIPGSCISITCVNCETKFMGTVELGKCGECEQRVRCLGLIPVKFETVDDNFDRIPSENISTSTGVFDVLRKRFI